MSRTSWVGRWWRAKSLGVQLAAGGLVAALFWLLWATLGIRVAYWAWVGEWLPWHALSDPGEVSKLGQIGDLFGGINALFAAFAFVGVAIAAYYQHQKYVLQTEQHERQAFEPLFFKLLDQHKVPSVLHEPWIDHDVNPPEVVWSEAKGLDSIAQMVRAGCSKVIERGDAHRPDGQFVCSDFEHVYEPIYSVNEAELGPYFRKLYHLFKFIATSRLTWEENVRYANIARAALNKDELTLLLNCGSKRGSEFKPLVECFGLLKHLSDGVEKGRPSIEQQVAAMLYSPTATMNSADRAKYWMYNPGSRPEWARDAPV